MPLTKIVTGGLEIIAKEGKKLPGMLTLCSELKPFARCKNLEEMAKLTDKR